MKFRDFRSLSNLSLALPFGAWSWTFLILVLINYWKRSLFGGALNAEVGVSTGSKARALRLGVKAGAGIKLETRISEP